MNPRERVRAALEHREPDRLPLDYIAEPQVTAALSRRLGVTSKEELLRALGVDVRWIEVPSLDRAAKRRQPTSESEDIWGIRRAGPFSGYTTYHPLAEATSRADVEAHPWPDPDDVDVATWLENCRAAGEHARMTVPRCRIFFDAIEMVGFEKFFAWLSEEPHLVDLVLDRITDYNEAVLHRLLSRADGELDVVFMSSDFGTQRSLLLGLGQWRRFVRPRFERVFRCVRGYGVKVLLHSDGAIRPVIPDLIEMGLDGLNPIQVGAAGMEPAGLKRDFGNRLAFHGAIDVQDTLPFGTPEDVRAEVRDRFRVLGAGGGYICTCSHSLLPDIPIDNILAMYETAREECRY
ncbi:MAG: hypothetical protein HYY04_05485 [Chloroflexi bacterium]|nr:hypothetical protein [Chloroflexota bacterium]